MTTVSAPARATWLTYAGAGLLFAAVVIIAGNVALSRDEPGGLASALVSAAGCIALAGALFVAVVPRTTRVDRTTVVLGAVTVLSLVVFWTGVTPVLASATWAMSTRAEHPSVSARTLRVVGVLAAAVAVVVSVVQKF